MTTIPITQEVRRDRWGRYLVVPPGATKPVGYTRVTTIAKTLDAGGGLAPWKATMAITGMLSRPGLHAGWEALYAETAGDPWYGGGKDRAKTLVEECASAGGATNRAELGTALHALTALHDTAGVEVPVPGLAADLEAYRTGLAAAGITVVDGAVELVTVLDYDGVAGTFDRLVRIPGMDLPVVADLKTGADLTYGWQSIAVQLAAYAHGDALYVQGPNSDGSGDIRRDMPAVDQSRALVIHLPAGEARMELHLVDITAGWEAFSLSLAVREWRGRRDLAGPLVATVDDGGIMRTWLRGRVAVVATHDDAKRELASRWPLSLPLPREAEKWTPEDLDQVEALLDLVEKRHGLPFGEPKPGG